MTTPISTAYVDIQPNTGNFAAELQRSIDDALRGVTRSVDAMSRNVTDSFNNVHMNGTRSLQGVERQANDSADGIGRSFVRAAKVAAGAFASVQVGKFFKDSVMLASDLTESINAVSVTLGKGATSFLEFGSHAADSLGVTQAALNSAIIPTASLLRNAGLSGDVLSASLQQLATRATDVGSVFNRETNDVLTAFGAALRGEQEPIRAFGVNLNEAGIAAKAVELGLADSTKAVSQAAKVQAAFALVMDQTAAAQGDFANTSDGLANRLRISQANFAELRTEIGVGLLPIVTEILGKFLDLVRAFREGEGGIGVIKDAFVGFGDYIASTFGPSFAELGDRFQQARPGLEELAAALMEMGVNIFPAVSRTIQFTVEVVGLLVLALGGIGSFINDHVDAFGTLATVIGTIALGIKAAAIASGIWTAVTGGLVTAFWALNGAMAANPIGLIVLAIAALVAGFVYAWKHSETFKEVVSKAFNALVSVIANAIKFMLNLIVGFWEGVISGAARAFGWVPGLGDKLQGAANAIHDFRVSANKEIDSIKNRVQITINADARQAFATIEAYKASMAGLGITVPGGKTPTGFSIAIDQTANAAKKAAEDAFDPGSFRTTATTGGGGGGGGSTAPASGGGSGAGGAASKAKEAADKAKKIAEDLKKDLAEIGKDIGGAFAQSLIASSTSEIESALKSLSDKIVSAYKDTKSSVDDKLVLAIAATNSKLQGLAGQRDALADQLQKANDKALEVAESARNFASLSGLGLNTSGATARTRTAAGTMGASGDDFVQMLQTRLKAIQDFQTDVNALIAKGVNKSLLSQIVSGGVEQAGMAKALANADAAALAQINATQASIDAAAASLGNSAADAMFDSGTAAGKGFLTGLKSQQAEIELVMTQIAQSMVSTIKKELKIKSPSQVFFDLGDDTMAGYINSLLASVPAVQAALQQAVSPGAIQGPSAGALGGAAGVVNSFAIEVNGVSDPEVGRRVGQMIGEGVAQVLATNQQAAALAGVGG